MVLVTLGARQGAGFLALYLGLPARSPRMPAPVSRAAPRTSMARSSATGSVVPYSAVNLFLIDVLFMGRGECGGRHRFRANLGVSLSVLPTRFGAETAALR